MILNCVMTALDSTVIPCDILKTILTRSSVMNYSSVKMCSKHYRKNYDRSYSSLCLEVIVHKQAL